MGLKSKPSETNKDVVNYDSSSVKSNKHNAFSGRSKDNLRLQGYSEEELLERLERKVTEGWFQVSDIFKEDKLDKRLRLDSERKQIKTTRAPRNRALTSVDMFFVYVSRVEPLVKREYKKAYRG